MLLTTIFFWYLLVLSASLLGALSSNGKKGKRYYKKLDLPSIAPKPWIFGVVWPILYLLQASACWLLQESNAGDEWTFELTLYCIFLGISTLWTPVFFKIQCNMASLIIMLLSTGMATATVYYFFVAHTLSGWLFLPTAIWVLFATYLMLCIYINNRENTYTRKQLSTIVEDYQNTVQVGRNSIAY